MITLQLSSQFCKVVKKDECEMLVGINVAKKELLKITVSLIADKSSVLHCTSTEEGIARMLSTILLFSVAARMCQRTVDFGEWE